MFSGFRDFLCPRPDLKMRGGGHKFFRADNPRQIEHLEENQEVFKFVMEVYKKV